MGVWYSYSRQQWAIFNENLQEMPTGSLFNVLIPSQQTAAFVHTATDITVDGYSFLDHPLLNCNPDAIILVTQNWNPGGSGGVYNDHPPAVHYDNDLEQWALF